MSAVVTWDGLSIIEAGGQVERYEVEIFEILAGGALDSSPVQVSGLFRQGSMYVHGIYA